MPKRNINLDTEIDIGKYLPIIYKALFIIGVTCFVIWFYYNVYKPEERKYISSSRYAYEAFLDEINLFYKKKGYIFKENDNDGNEFCKQMAFDYAKNKVGSCKNFNPLVPAENFIFKNKNISVYGLEKPPFLYGESLVKDIVIDTNTEKEGDNQIGVDKLILRIYSTGSVPAIITPVNCSKQDEKEYGLQTSIYCIGSPEINYLVLNKPLGFDIEQIGAEDGKTRIISKNTSFLRADCSAFGGFISGGDEYCSNKSYYVLKGCDDDYSCNIALTKY